MIDQENPFTDSIAAGIMSVRELCGQRIPFNHWEVWMDRMYGTDALFSTESQSDSPELQTRERLFNAAGRVARIILTYDDAKTTKEKEVGVRQVWEEMNLCEAFEDLYKHSLLSVEDRSTLVHSKKVATEISRGGCSFHVDRTLNTLILTLIVSKNASIPDKVFAMPVLPREEQKPKEEEPPHLSR